MATSWNPPLPPPDPDMLELGHAGDGAAEAGPLPSSPWRLVAVVAGIAALGMWSSWWTALFVVVLLTCIFLHELGHYLAARWGGMKATEFFVGFGPRLWSIRRGETEWGLKAIPLGAYVKVVGMSNLDEVPAADEARTYRAQRFSRRFNLAVAGSAMHFTIALVLLAVLFAGFGERRVVGWSVAAVEPGTAAATAGLLPGDRVISLDGVPTTDFDALRAAVAPRPGRSVELMVEREGATVPVRATLGSRPVHSGVEGFLGIRPQLLEETGPVQSPPAAVGSAFVEFGRIVGRSVTGIGAVFSPSGLSEYVATLQGDENTDKRMLSPVGAARIGGIAGEQGVDQFLFLIAVMNVFIGMFNLIPLLPFDGGHAVIAIYERIRSRGGQRYYADIRKMLPVMYAVLLVMGLLFLGNLYLDVFRGLPG
ncbi:MAG: M50 family metallopeptidase [Acidimicrobiales bacterium]